MEIKSQSPIFIFGTGTFGVDTARALLSSGYNVTGFVSNQEIRNNINGINVYEWEQLSIDADAQLLPGDFEPKRRTVFFYKQAIEFGFKKVFLPWDFIGHIEQEMGWRFWLKPKEFLLEHRKHLEHVLPILE